MTKPVFRKLLCNDAITVKEFDTLFNWFDKVRIACWRGHLVFSNNPYHVIPHQAVDDAIGQLDSIFWISKANVETKRISIFQPDPFFSLYPHLIGLICNDVVVLNYCAPQAGLWFLPETDPATINLPLEILEWANDYAVEQNCDRWPLWNAHSSIVFRPGRRKYIPPLDPMTNRRLTPPHIYVDLGKRLACLPHAQRPRRLRLSTRTQRPLSASLFARWLRFRCSRWTMLNASASRR